MAGGQHPRHSILSQGPSLLITIHSHHSVRQHQSPLAKVIGQEMSPMELLCFEVSKMDDRNLGQSTAKPISGGRPTKVGERETSTQREAHLKDE